MSEPLLRTPLTSEPLLRASGIAKWFGSRRALDALDLTLRPGDRLAVLGPNGAGKSTLLRLLSGLARASAGRLELPGVRRSERRVALRRRVGYVGHSSLLYPALTGLENLVLTGRLYGVRRPTERARTLLAELGLEEYAECRAQTFSRGVAQRMAVARALVHEPRVLLFDEPFSGLDPEAAPALEASVELLMGESPGEAGGRALVLVTHDLPSASRLCRRGLILRAGRHREIPVLGASEALHAVYAQVQEELRGATSTHRGGDA